MACYLMGYGLVRCVIETFRGDSLYIGAIKVSQLLSGILVVAGIILIVLLYTIRKKGKNNESENKNS